MILIIDVGLRRCSRVRISVIVSLDTLGSSMHRATGAIRLSFSAALGTSFSNGMQNTGFHTISAIRVVVGATGDTSCMMLRIEPRMEVKVVKFHLERASKITVHCCAPIDPSFADVDTRYAVRGAENTS